MSDAIKSIVSLKSLLSTSKNVEIEYPGMPGFKVQLTFLSRETLVKIRKKATATTMKKGQPVETLNDEMFLQLYTQACVKGWSGLKLSYLEQLAPVNLEGQDMENTLAYDEENALFLMKQSNDFDAFVSDRVTDLSNFPSASGAK